MRERERPGKKSLAASVGVHALAVVGAWLAQVSTPEFQDFITYEITLVSLPTVPEAPAPTPPPEEELVVETPEPVVEEEPPPVVEEERARVEERPRPTPPQPEREPVEDPGAREPSPEVGREEIAVRMEGVRRDYPAYYDNILRQMNRCMRFSGPGGLKTSVYFVIGRAGTVDMGQFRFASRSGNATFDFAVMGAVECAGTGRFGPLPEDLGWDRLPIIFEMTSARRDGGGGGPPGNRHPPAP